MKQDPVASRDMQHFSIFYYRSSVLKMKYALTGKVSISKIMLMLCLAITEGISWIFYMNCPHFLQSELKSSSKVQLLQQRESRSSVIALQDGACSACKKRAGMIIRAGLLLSAVIAQTHLLGKPRPLHPELKQNTYHKKSIPKTHIYPSGRGGKISEEEVAKNKTCSYSSSYYKLHLFCPKTWWVSERNRHKSYIFHRNIRSLIFTLILCKYFWADFIGLISDLLQ